MNQQSRDLRAASETERSAMLAAVRQIGDQWSLLILWLALRGTTRFDHFQTELGIARNVLSNRLSRLVDYGLLDKIPVQPEARRLEYCLTERGEALRPALKMLEAWGRGATTASASRD